VTKQQELYRKGITMTFEKGLAVIEATDTETKSFFIDQDALEFARLNAKLDKQRNEAEKAQKKADRKHTKAEKAKAERKAYTLKTAGRVLLNCAISVATGWAGIAGLVHPIISASVSVFCLCVACVRFGTWFGRVVKK
jgi:hypothetical protein